MLCPFLYTAKSDSYYCLYKGLFTRARLTGLARLPGPIANVSHTLINKKIDLVSLYFRLLWYHSILKGSVDQYSEIHSPFACSRWPTWFPDLSRPYVACVKRGSGETYVRSQSRPSRQSNSPRLSHVGRRKIQISPPTGEQDLWNTLRQGQQRQSNPHPMPCLLPPPPPPRRLHIDRCLKLWVHVRIPVIVTSVLFVCFRVIISNLACFVRIRS